MGTYLFIFQPSEEFQLGFSFLTLHILSLGFALHTRLPWSFGQLWPNSSNLGLALVTHTSKYPIAFLTFLQFISQLKSWIWTSWPGGNRYSKVGRGLKNRSILTAKSMRTVETGIVRGQRSRNTVKRGRCHCGNPKEENVSWRRVWSIALRCQERWGLQNAHWIKPPGGR